MEMYFHCVLNVIETIITLNAFLKNESMNESIMNQ